MSISVSDLTNWRTSQQQIEQESSIIQVIRRRKGTLEVIVYGIVNKGHIEWGVDGFCNGGLIEDQQIDNKQVSVGRMIEKAIVRNSIGQERVWKRDEKGIENRIAIRI